MERKLISSHSGGLALLDMDFAYRGLSFAENICQKWGNICLDNVVVQDQCKYVNAAGEHIRKVLDEVAKDWLNPSSGCVEGPVSDLSLESNVINEICDKLRGVHVGYQSSQNFPLCVELETFSSSVEDLSPSSLTNSSINSHHKKEKQIPSSAKVSRSNCSTDREESCNNDSYPETGSSLVRHNEVTEGESMLSVSTVSTGRIGSCASENVASFIRSHSERKQTEANVSKASAGLPENGDGQGFSNFDEEVMPNIGVDAKEPMEEFEDIKVEDFSNDTEAYEVAVSKNLVLENMSYKKKRKFTFRWKLPSSKWYGGKNMVNKRGVTSSLASNKSMYPKTMSTSSSCGSEWELL